MRRAVCFAFLLVLLPALALTPNLSLAAKNTLTKNQIIEKTEKKVGGKALSVKLGKDKNKYQIRVLLDNGRVKTVNVDKATGKILKASKPAK